MLSLEDLRIDRFQSNPQMPWGMRVMHTPSGLSVEGNCKQESGYDRLQEVLVAALNQSIMKEWKAPAKAAQIDLRDQNAMLLEQLAQMQAQIDRLMSPMQVEVTGSAIPKRRGRPPKTGKAAKKAKVGRAKGEAEPDAFQSPGKVGAPAAGSKEELDFIQGQLRAPTDSPVDQYAPGTHRSRGGVAVKVSDEALKKGIRP